jgi:hypothetical protein
MNPQVLRGVNGSELVVVELLGEPEHDRTNQDQGGDFHAVSPAPRTGVRRHEGSMVSGRQRVRDARSIPVMNRPDCHHFGLINPE